MLASKIAVLKKNNKKKATVNFVNVKINPIHKLATE
jgi:hypothetical protein